MKQLGMKHVGFIALLFIVLMSGYYFYRQNTVNPLVRDLRETREKINQKQLAEI